MKFTRYDFDIEVQPQFIVDYINPDGQEFTYKFMTMKDVADFFELSTSKTYHSLNYSVPCKFGRFQTRNNPETYIYTDDKGNRLLFSRKMDICEETGRTYTKVNRVILKKLGILEANQICRQDHPEVKSPDPKPDPVIRFKSELMKKLSQTIQLVDP